VKKNVFLIIFILLFLIITANIIFKKSKIQAQPEVKIGMTAPNFELKDIEGKSWKLDSLRGKIVILNFWASWCKECIVEKKSIQVYLNKNKKTDDLVFLTILFKDNPKLVSELIKKEGYTFPVLIDNGKVSKIYGIRGVPETFLIDKNGILRHKITGPVEWNSPHIIPHLKEVLS
jgi:peroxiredoxin